MTQQYWLILLSFCHLFYCFIRDLDDWSPVSTCRHCWLATGRLRDVLSQGWQVANGDGLELGVRDVSHFLGGSWGIGAVHTFIIHILFAFAFWSHSFIIVHLLFVCFSVSPLVITRFALEARGAQFSQGFGGVPDAWFQGVHRFELHDAWGGVLKYFGVVRASEAVWFRKISQQVY